MSEKFSEILREYLVEERQKNPAINEIAISKKMGIPPTTFNRLLNGYSKKASVNTIIKLSQFIPELKKTLPEEIVKLFEVYRSGLKIDEKSRIRVLVEKDITVQDSTMLVQFHEWNHF